MRAESTNEGIFKRDGQSGRRRPRTSLGPASLALERVLVERLAQLEPNVTAGVDDSASERHRLEARNYCPTCPAGAVILSGGPSLGQESYCCPTHGRLTLVTVIKKIFVYRKTYVRTVRVTQVVEKTVRLRRFFGR